MRRIFLLLALLGFTMGGCGVEWFPSAETASGTSAARTVAAFAFSPASITGATRGAVLTSDAITAVLSGVTSAVISVSDGQYSINGGGYTSATGTVKNGDTVTVQHTAASEAALTVSTTLTIGEKSATFSSTTAGFAVSAFSFSPVFVGISAGSTQTSDAVTLAIRGDGAPISVSGGHYSINGGTYTSAAGTVQGGDRVTVRHIAAADGAQTVTTLTVGDKSATFISSTASSVAGVTAFSFAPLAGVSTGSTSTSNAITVAISGGTSAAISVTDGQYSVNGGSYTSAAGTVQNSDTVTVRHTASSVAGQAVTTTLTIGDKSATFSSTTASATVLKQ